MEGVAVKLDDGKCVQCGSCSEICFTKAVKVADGRFEIDQNLCRGCGRCAEQCPADAITVVYDEGAIDGIADRIGSLVRLNDRDQIAD
jgi:MinD superfamily P-loop ATPase